MKRSLIIIFSLLILFGVSSAQQSDVGSLKGSSSNAISGLGVSPAKSPFSLIDLSRIKWSNSYSVAFFSGGGSSGSVGLWNTTMDYQISSKLFLAVNLGVLHNPGAMWNKTESSGARFCPDSDWTTGRPINL